MYSNVIVEDKTVLHIYDIGTNVAPLRSTHEASILILQLSAPGLPA